MKHSDFCIHVYTHMHLLKAKRKLVQEFIILRVKLDSFDGPSLKRVTTYNEVEKEGENDNKLSYYGTVQWPMCCCKLFLFSGLANRNGLNYQ